MRGIFSNYEFGENVNASYLHRRTDVNSVVIIDTVYRSNNF